MSFPRLTLALVICGPLAAGCRTDTGLLEANRRQEAVLEPPGPGPHWGPWSTPQNLGPVVNSTANDQHPAISKDGLSLFFASNRAGGNGGLDLYVSHRASVEDSWQAPVNLGSLINSDTDDLAPNFTPDEHNLFYHSARAGGCGAADLYVAHRTDKHDDLAWETPVNLGCVINTPFEDAGPTLFEVETGATLMLFNSRRPGGPGDLDIYQSVRAADGSFGPATLVSELSGPFRDTRTSVYKTGLELFLSSESTGRPGGMGGQDLWRSTRSSTQDPWSTPENLGPAVNTTSFDGAPALSFDGATLYFFSNRVGGSGGNDLYVMTRQRAP